MKKILLLVLLLIPGLMMADNVSVEKARNVAEAFLSRANAPQTRSAQLKMVWDGESPATRSGGHPAFYVFNNESGTGFVIVAADDVATPIIGYSFDRNFEVENMPQNIKGWMDGVRREINFARENNYRQNEIVRKAWADTQDEQGEVVVAHETAQWDQTEPYNTFCPVKDDKPTYTGCVITAVSILLKYFNWPDCGQGTIPAFTSQDLEIEVPAIELGYPYQWDKMKMTYEEGKYTQEEGEAVARLMADCGAMLKANYGTYGTSGTGAYMEDIPGKLTLFMKYDESMQLLYRDYYTLEEWYRIINAELVKAPLIYGGMDNHGAGGHSFILDGFTDNEFYHVNWGWAGSNNGYFRLTNLEPYDQGSGGTGSNFNSDQSAICYARKDEGGMPESPLGYMKYSDTNTGKTYNGISKLRHEDTFETGKTVPIKAGMVVALGEGYYGPVKFVLVDKNGKWKEELEDPEANTWFFLDMGYGSVIPKFNVTIKGPIEKGDKIRLYREDNSKLGWQPVKGMPKEGCVWELPVAESAAPDLDILKATQMHYSKSRQQITLTLPQDAAVTLLSPAGKTIYKNVSYNYNQTLISTRDLPTGTYTLRFTLGSRIQEMKLTVGDNNL